MIKIKNGIIERVGLPNVGTLTDGSTVSNYDKLPQETLMGEGWLPVEDDKPTFDTLTQYLVFDSYEILADKVIAHYKSIDIGLDPQTLADGAKALEKAKADEKAEKEAKKLAYDALISENKAATTVTKLNAVMDKLLKWLSK